jgi:hypothetical protein
MSSPVTIQPSSADTFFDPSHATTNYGTDTTLHTRPKWTTGFDERRRIAIKFDFSAAVPAGATISLATLSLYDGTPSSDSRRTITVSRLLRTDWVDTEALWAVYKTGSNWGTAGALNTTSDVSTTDAAVSDSPASAGWQNWTVTAQVQTARDSVGGIAHFLVADEGGDSATAGNIYCSRENTNTSLLPKLYIEYTVPGATAPTGASFLLRMI